jgi:hypothetical protein
MFGIRSFRAQSVLVCHVYVAGTDIVASNAGALAQAQSKSPGQTSVDEKIRSRRIPADKVMMKPAKIAVKLIQKTIEETPKNEESSSLSDPSSGPEDSEDRPLPGVILPNACKPQFPSLGGLAEKSGSRSPQEHDFKCK